MSGCRVVPLFVDEKAVGHQCEVSMQPICKAVSSGPLLTCSPLMSKSYGRVMWADSELQPFSLYEQVILSRGD